MISVGVRQLKNGLTRYLRLVEQGHAVLVMNRNRAVAVVKKPDWGSAQTLEEKIAALVAEGRLLPGGKGRGFQAVQAGAREREALSPD